jgi:hypothetical protein
MTPSTFNPRANVKRGGATATAKGSLRAGEHRPAHLPNKENEPRLIEQLREEVRALAALDIAPLTLLTGLMRLAHELAGTDEELSLEAAEAALDSHRPVDGPTVGTEGFRVGFDKGFSASSDV